MSPPAQELRTPRLLLRRWRPEDREPFARLNADPVAMAYFPRPLTRRESDELADRIEAGLAADDFGLWAVEAPGIAPFLGFVGLSVPGFEAPFQPAPARVRKACSRNPARVTSPSANHMGERSVVAEQYAKRSRVRPAWPGCGSRTRSAPIPGGRRGGSTRLSRA